MNTASPRLVRFLVGVQHRPATTAATAYGFIAACGFLLPNDSGVMPALTYLTIATFVSCAVAAATCRATSMWQRIVVIGLALGSTLPATFAAFGDDDRRPWLAAIVVVGVSLPHATTGLVDRFRSLGRPATIAVLAYFAAGLVIVSAPFASRMLGGYGRTPTIDSGGVVGLALWLAALQCAFHAATDSRYGALPLGALASAIGATCGIWTLAFLHPGYYREPPIWKCAALSAGAWLVGALLIPVARTGRSFTAVPEGHAIRTDFDVHAERRGA